MPDNPPDAPRPSADDLNLMAKGVQVEVHSLLTMPDATKVAWLSQQEVSRAERFHFEHHRRRFLAAHCALRETLSRRTGIEPALLQWTEGPFGKPQLAGNRPCHFNLSHSDDVALVAFSLQRPVGVDIEMLRPMRDVLALAEANFSALEYREFLGTHVLQRDEVFLRVWTRKEACLKAVGVGLGLPPSSIEVGLQPEARQVIVQMPDGQTAQVLVESLEAVPHALAAQACVLQTSAG